MPTDEAMTEDSHEAAARIDNAGEDKIPNQSTDHDNLPEVDMDRPLPVTFGNEIGYAPTWTEMMPCRRHRDGMLQPMSLPKVGPNRPYPWSLKGTHRRVHRHYQCNDLTLTALWAAAYRENPGTRHIYKVAIRSPTAKHQLRDAKLSFDDGKFFHLTTVGKRVRVPRTLVTSIVAMYHESELYGHSGVLQTMALIKPDYVCFHLPHYLECYILSCDVCPAAKSRTRQHCQAAQTPNDARHQMALCVCQLSFWTAPDHKRS